MPLLLLTRQHSIKIHIKIKLNKKNTKCENRFENHLQEEKLIFSFEFFFFFVFSPLSNLHFHLFHFDEN